MFANMRASSAGAVTGIMTGTYLLQLPVFLLLDPLPRFHVAAEDVQLTFLCTAIMAGCALYRSFPPYPILDSGLF